MKYEALNINLKVGMCVYDIDSCFPTTTSRAILKPRRWIVEKLKKMVYGLEIDFYTMKISIQHYRIAKKQFIVILFINKGFL